MPSQAATRASTPRAMPIGTRRPASETVRSFEAISCFSSARPPANRGHASTGRPVRTAKRLAEDLEQAGAGSGAECAFDYGGAAEPLGLVGAGRAEETGPAFGRQPIQRGVGRRDRPFRQGGRIPVEGAVAQ